MSEKRKRSERDGDSGREKAVKKPKRGFVVGPDNLPDGAQRRKNQKIKKSLIQKAQIKKDYAKVKRQQGNLTDERETVPQPAFVEPEGETNEPSTAPHPDRQTLIEAHAEPAEPDRDQRWQRKRKPKATPFKREYEEAQQRKAEAEERRRAREEAERQRGVKIAEREKFRRSMAKARTGGPNGQRKLGRESKVLLEKVKRMVGDGG